MLFNKNNCCNRQMGFNTPMMGGYMDSQMECPVIEPTINKCIEKEFYHEIPQDCFFMIEKRNSLYKNILFIMKLIY